MTEAHEETCEETPEDVAERIPLDDENDRYYESLKTALFELYDSAKARNELDFVRAITADLWHSTGADTSIAAESQMFFNDYMLYFEQVEFTRINLRIALGFYCQLARGAGYYEIIANLLRIVGGERYREWPFGDLPDGSVAATPTGILRVLAEQAASSGRTELAGVIREAFNEELVTSYERAELLLREDGMRLMHKNGKEPAFLTLAEFHAYVERSLRFFEMPRELTAKHLTKYQKEKKVRGRLNDGPEQEYTVRADLRNRKMTISG